MGLRPYQQTAVANLHHAFKQYRRVMLQLPTGGGKTVIFVDITQRAIAKNNRVLLLVHRQELIKQAFSKMYEIGLVPGIIQSGHAPNPHANVQIASVQTLVRRNMPPDIGIIICDEAHHSTANSYRKIYDAFPVTPILGVTATPVRTNGEGFRDLFEHMVNGPTFKQLQKHGYLVPPKVLANPIKFDLNKLSTSKNGDYKERDLMARLANASCTADLVKSYQQHCNGKKMAVFGINVLHSKMITEQYCNAGISAVHLDGDTPDAERVKILRDYAAGHFMVLSNVGIITEGFDVPDIEAVQLTRPTRSLALYLQCVGRGSRPAPNKPFFTVLDHANCCFEHGLPNADRVWTLDGIQKKAADSNVVVRDKQTRLLYPADNIPDTVKDIELVEITEELRTASFFKHKAKAVRLGWKPVSAYYKFLEDVDNKPTRLELHIIAAQLGYKPFWVIAKMKELNLISNGT